MAMSHFLSVVKQSESQQRVIESYIACYLLRNLLSLSNQGTPFEQFQYFNACELSHFYLNALNNTDIYNNISGWNKCYRKRCSELIHSLGKEKFLSLDRLTLKPNSIFYQYRSFLWLVSDTNKDPYQDPFAIAFGLNILASMWFWATVKDGQLMGNFPSDSEIQSFFARIGIGIDNLTLPLPERAYELQNLFLSESLGRTVKITTQIVLSRFPIINTKEHILQFLYEEFEGMKRAESLSPYVEDLLNSSQDLIKNYKSKEDVYSIDGPEGPQVALRLIAGSLLDINSELGCMIATSVVENICELYRRYNDSINIQQSDFWDDNFWLEIIELSKNYEILSSIIKGNLYQDMYEYMSLVTENIYLNRRLVEQECDNSVLAEKTKKLEKINKEQKEQLIREKNSSEQLISEAVKYLNELDQEKGKNLVLQRANSNLQITIAGLQRLSKKFGVDKVNEELKIDLLQLFARNKNLTVTSCLKLIELLCVNQIYVHPDAYKSARDVDGIFINCGRLLSQLSILATTYYKDIQTQGEQEAKKAFTTNEYAASESETIRNSNSPEYWTDRTIFYNGKEYKLTRHLKISKDFNVKYAIRTYFMFDSENKKIVIGYCGKHPKNTKS